MKIDLRQGRKVLLVANTSWYLYNFRRQLARSLRERGLRPVFVAPRDEYSAKLLEEGFEWLDWPLSQRHSNPWREALALDKLYGICRRETPVASHHFTVKCVVYGSLASWAARVPTRVNAVTGLGHVFLSHSFRARALRGVLKAAYRWIFSLPRTRVIFQNPEDREFFIENKLVHPERTRLIRSSGVSLQAFQPSASPTPPQGRAAQVRVLFAGRLLREKGIFELIEAIRILRAKTDAPTLQFWIAGTIYEGNPSSITPAQLDAWQKEGLADFLGHVDPIRDRIAACDLVVLPSYREGTPKILLEACAMEKAVIATDVPGCREVVKHGENGWLVPAQDAPRLAQAIEELARDEELRRKMGKWGRMRVVAEFSDIEIARQTVQVYEELGLLSRTPVQASLPLDASA